MYTRELARIKAVQYKQYKSRYGTTAKPTTPLSFPEWFLGAVRKYEANGADFFLNSETGQVQIFWKNTNEIVFRSKEDLYNEYLSYCSKFKVFTNVKFEENAGVSA